MKIQTDPELALRDLLLYGQSVYFVPSKPHLKREGAYWSVYLDGRLISSWPTIEAAWLRFKEYTK